MKKMLKKINLQKERLIISILGEVCWGFKIDNFEHKIGVKKDIVEQLLERLLREEKEGKIETFLSKDELAIVKKSFQEVEKEIEEWEYQTRIGLTLDEANVLIERVFSEI